MNRSPVDDAELRIRLIPGVLIVGVEQLGEGRSALTVVLDGASDIPSVEEELRLLTEPLVDVELRVRPLTSFLSGAAMLERMLDRAGAVSFAVEGDQASGIRRVEVTVERLADVSRVNDVVGGVLGEEFVRSRLEVELRIPLTGQGPSRRDVQRGTLTTSEADRSGRVDHQPPVDRVEGRTSDTDL